jgi:hypothetical protein
MNDVVTVYFFEAKRTARVVVNATAPAVQRINQRWRRNTLRMLISEISPSVVTLPRDDSGTVVVGFNGLETLEWSS